MTLHVEVTHIEVIIPWFEFCFLVPPFTSMTFTFLVPKYGNNSKLPGLFQNEMTKSEDSG
jgi:hypothetical protein